MALGSPFRPLLEKLSFPFLILSLYSLLIPVGKGKVIGTLRKGARVRVMSQNGEWSEIGYKGKKVWVATRYLKKRS